MDKMTRRLFIGGGLAAVASLGGYSFHLWTRFGALPSEAPVSPHWQVGAFHNLPDNYINPDLHREPAHPEGWLKFFLERDSNRYPPEPVPSVSTDLASLNDGEFVWLGHSSLLLKLSGKTICIDPVLSSRASPVPFTIPAWAGSTPYDAEGFPHIDYLCITHDHWDHLDYEAVTQLKYDHVLCGKGVGAHFSRWGLPMPHELDWGEMWEEGDVRLVFTPSRHFSGRGLARNRSLWGGFVIDGGSGGKVYVTGDGGYGSHFCQIGEKYGPFDIIFPDSGQYNRDWASVHMFPEEAAMACRDTRVRLACPVHIGKFTLAWHPWNEPTARFAKKVAALGQPFILPIIGEKYSIDGKKGISANSQQLMDVGGPGRGEAVSVHVP